jgi:hypothetical protein
MEESSNKPRYEPWNKGKLVGQKAPFKRLHPGTNHSHVAMLHCRSG